MLERDLILRLVKDVARVLARVAGLRAEGQLAQAISEVEAAASSLLGVDFTLVLALDSNLLVARLDNPERIFALARLCRERGSLASDEGDPLLSQSMEKKTIELWLEAGAAGATLPDEALLEIASAKPEALGPRYQSLRHALVG